MNTSNVLFRKYYILIRTGGGCRARILLEVYAMHNSYIELHFSSYAFCLFLNMANDAFATKSLL